MYYGSAAERKFESFNYSELIEMQINALDLLGNPEDYLFDPENHKMVMNKP